MIRDGQMILNRNMLADLAAKMSQSVSRLLCGCGQNAISAKVKLHRLENIDKRKSKVASKLIMLSSSTVSV